MKSSAKNIVLKSVDDIFQTEENRADAQRERVQEIPLDQLKPFKNHPFKVRDDQRMLDTVDSIREYGVLVPAIARPDPEGGYELISGHRRKRGCEMAGLQTMPVIIRDLDDDAAVLVMVDSNIQREELLPSERAFAYKMKLEALKHQGARSDLTSSQLGTKLRADELLAQQAGESRNQVQRFISLTELISELLDMAHQLEILELLEMLNKTQEKTIALVIHDLNQSARFSDWIIAMRDGKVLYEGTPEEIMTPEVFHNVFSLDAYMETDPWTQKPMCVTYRLEK